MLAGCGRLGGRRSRGCPDFCPTNCRPRARRRGQAGDWPPGCGHGNRPSGGDSGLPRNCPKTSAETVRDAPRLETENLGDSGPQIGDRRAGPLVRRRHLDQGHAEARYDWDFSYSWLAIAGAHLSRRPAPARLFLVARSSRAGPRTSLVETIRAYTVGRGKVCPRRRWSSSPRGAVPQGRTMASVAAAAVFYGP